MSVTPGLGAFNKDKVASKFGIQLKPKDATSRPAAEKKSLTTTTTTATSSTVVKNKTIGDFRADSSTNGFLNKTPETPRKPSTLVNTSKLSTSNDNHSKTNSKTSITPKSPSTTKRSSLAPTDNIPSTTLNNKPSNVQKTEAQIEHQKDQPLYRRQPSKPLENTTSSSTTSSLPATTTTTTTNSLKR